MAASTPCVLGGVDATPCVLLEKNPRLDRAAREGHVPTEPQGQRRAGENGVTCGSSGSLIFVSMNDMSQYEWERGIKRFDAEARPGDVVYVQVPAMHTVFAPRLIGEICTFKTIEAFKERLENRLAGLAALRRRGLSVVVALASPAVRKSNFNGIHVMVAALIRPSSPRY